MLLQSMPQSKLHVPSHRHTTPDPRLHVYGPYLVSDEKPGRGAVNDLYGIGLRYSASLSQNRDKGIDATRVLIDDRKRI
jgi:hypothetical protein